MSSPSEPAQGSVSSPPAAPAQATARPEAIPAYEPYHPYAASQAYSWAPASAPLPHSLLGHPPFPSQAISHFGPPHEYRPPFEPSRFSEPSMSRVSPLVSLQQQHAAYSYSFSNHSNLRQHNPYPDPSLPHGPYGHLPPSTTTKSAPLQRKHSSDDDLKPTEPHWQARSHSEGETSATLPPWSYSAPDGDGHRGHLPQQGHPPVGGHWAWDDPARPRHDVWFAPDTHSSSTTPSSGGDGSRDFILGPDRRHHAYPPEGPYSEHDGTPHADPIAESKPRKARRRNGEPPRALEKRRYNCELCIDEPRLFARPSALKIHMLTHTKEKPHVCNVCSRAFAIASNLKRHHRLHETEEDPAPSPPLQSPVQHSWNDNSRETARQATGSY